MLNIKNIASGSGFSSAEARKSLSRLRLNLIASAYLVATCNVTFFQKFFSIYPVGENISFSVSMIVFLTLMILLILSLVGLIFPARIVVATTIIFASTVSYFTDQYGTVFDTGMIQNLLETNLAESKDIINLGTVFRILLVSLLPIIWLVWIQYESRSWVRDRINSLLVIFATIVILLLNVYAFNKDYAGFFREHKPVRYYINPVFPVYSIIKLASNDFLAPRITKIIPLNSSAKIVSDDKERELIILVVGETARADHFALNGYKRQTTPLLSQENNIISYTNMTACGTSTSISVPCMFSHDGHDSFDSSVARNTENILDLLTQAGISVLWRDNNSSSKGVANRIPYQDFRSNRLNPLCQSECRDVGMLDGLQQFIDNQKNDILIVLHQIGSHGPSYYKRYPKKFERFKPICNFDELSKCSREAIVNSYDNTILYTDYFISESIKLLKANTPKFETNLLYISDHGESLGENGIYLHGLPYFIAPDEQIKIPAILWVGDSSDIDYDKTAKLKDETLSHDALFDMLLTLFEVHSKLEPASKNPAILLKPE